MAMLAMMAVMPAVTARGELHRLKVKTDNAAGHIDTGLALEAQRLKRVGVLRAAPQQIAAAADEERDVAADAAVVAGEIAAAEALGRCMHRPCEAGVLGHAEVDAEARNMREIRLRLTALTAKYAFQGCRGRDDHADVLAAVAFEHADLNALLRIRRGERGDECREGDTEK